MARRSDHTRDELRKLIMDRAWKVIGREGFGNLTARRLAREIGYAPGTIYNIFASMDDLYLALNARTLDALYEVMASRACNDPRKTPVQNMKKMASLYLAFAQEYRPHWLMLFSHRLADRGDLPGWYQEKIDRLFDPLEELLKPYFSSRQAQRRKMAARVLWASVHGLCFLQETGKISLVGNREAADMASYLVDTFIAGVTVRGPRA